MDTRKLIASTWLLVALCSGPFLTSCANKNVEETADSADGYEETTAEADASEGEKTADNEEASTDGEIEKQDADFEPLAANDDFENLSFDEQGVQDAASTEGDAKASETAASADTSTESLGESLFADTANNGEAANTAEAIPAENSDIGLGAPPATPPASSAKTSRPFRASVMPKIPQEAIVKSGTSLNRYYFLRKGDSPNSVAKLIYSEEGRAEDLTTWNSTAWVPGNLIYYVSPQEAGDNVMKSLYEERNLKAQKVHVKRGESISQIAMKQLGHVNSWKELAVVNHLAHPDNLTRGQSLNFYPDLGEAPAIVAAPIVPAPVVQAAPPQVTPPPPPPVVEAPKAPPVQKPPERNRGTDVNISKLLKQNLFFITMGLGVGLLLLALVAINRKKRDSAAGGGEEFNEDAFTPPRKKRR